MSTQNCSVLDHAALCWTSRLPEMFSRSPAHPVCCYSRTVVLVQPLHLAILQLPGQIPQSSSSLSTGSQQVWELCWVQQSLEPLWSGPGHVENAAPGLVSLTHSWPGSLGALVVLICCFCFILELGGICVPVILVFGAQGSAGSGSRMVQRSGRTGICHLLSVRLFIS